MAESADRSAVRRRHENGIHRAIEATRTPHGVESMNRLVNSDSPNNASGTRASGLFFIITIDTEGDDVWARHRRVTTENARFLPRFQQLCEEYGFKPTYLVNHEMAIDSTFQRFGRSVIKSGNGEIGLHLHPWNSPPFFGETDGGSGDHVYMYEVADELLYAKLEYLTNLLSSTFEVRPTSHRAGRWGFNGRIARQLENLGYLADCSVTPGVSFRQYKGSQNGDGGPDYFGFPMQPYFLDLNNISQSGKSRLLEVPMTIRPNYSQSLARIHHLGERGISGKVLRAAYGSPYSWLRPNGRNRDAMIALVESAVEDGWGVLEFMIHSSDLMPNGSPTFRTGEQVELLYQHVTSLFNRLESLGARGITLGDYRSLWEERNG
jgi:hypothetical protein